VGGFVTPGDHVDVMMTEGSAGELRTLTILQSIRVIGVDQSAEERTETPAVARTVTVEVTPEEGQRLALAQKAGTLSLTLRQMSDGEDEPLEMIQLRDLLHAEAASVEGLPPRKRTIKIRRANVSETVEIN
jgi:pilus assembly protein CpaB